MLAVLLLLAMLGLPGAPARGTPVFTVLTGPEAVGGRPFLHDLGTIWKHLHRPMPGLLAVSEVDDPARRLRLLERGRGHFAVIDTPLAVRRLAEHPRLAAIGLLWPEFLHVLTADRAQGSLALPLAGPVNIAPSARYVHEALLEWSADKPGQRALLRLARPPDLSLPLTGGDLWVYSAAAPDEAVAGAMAVNAGMRLLPVSPKLVEELRLLFPWLQTGTLNPGTYPGLRTRLVLPVRHLLMVGRRDLAPETVEKMLRSLYDRRKAAAPFNPLFATLEEKANVVFAKLIPFHPAAAKALGFPR